MIIADFHSFRKLELDSSATKIQIRIPLYIVPKQIAVVHLHNGVVEGTIHKSIVLPGLDSNFHFLIVFERLVNFWPHCAMLNVSVLQYRIFSR